ncbi:hypothetical protein PR048_005283 [Dryococelus australis]|uniref:YqaJ viral recombinase domain-containing protein n=1 Tax=Dryococelus australis TaxID=614101 RepID=A0ABQ9I896_9NEOP|nr:hypothetical protein PR048_005283 [Dryococelus australis]
MRQPSLHTCTLRNKVTSVYAERRRTEKKERREYHWTSGSEEGESAAGWTLDYMPYFAALLQVTLEKRDRIAVQMVAQRKNEVRHDERQGRLTLNNFEVVCRRKDSTPCCNLAKRLLYGIFVDLKRGYLGARPDCLVREENSLVECKENRTELSANFGFFGNYRQTGKASYKNVSGVNILEAGIDTETMVVAGWVDIFCSPQVLTTWQQHTVFRENGVAPHVRVHHLLLSPRPSLLYIAAPSRRRFQQATRSESPRQWRAEFDTAPPPYITITRLTVKFEKESTVCDVKCGRCGTDKMTMDKRSVKSVLHIFTGSSMKLNLYGKLRVSQVPVNQSKPQSSHVRRRTCTTSPPLDIRRTRRSFGQFRTESVVDAYQVWCKVELIRKLRGWKNKIIKVTKIALHEKIDLLCHVSGNIQPIPAAFPFPLLAALHRFHTWMVSDDHAHDNSRVSMSVPARRLVNKENESAGLTSKYKPATELTLQKPSPEDHESNPGPPECESSKLPLRHLAWLQARGMKNSMLAFVKL